MSWPVRVVARLGGLTGDREAALALLAEAATPGSDTESDALLLLIIIDTREGRPVDAIEPLFLASNVSFRDQRHNAVAPRPAAHRMSSIGTPFHAARLHSCK